MQNRRWVLAERPQGKPQLANFRLETVQLPSLKAEGDVVVRNKYLSLDPYMRWRMNSGKSYAKPVEINDVMVGATVGEVTDSRHPDFVPGDMVLAAGGWQDYAIVQGAMIRRLETNTPPTTALGILGSPGFTAYAGLMKIGLPRKGETVVVGAATGPVGSMVGQLAKLAGCRAVAIAGGREKCDLAIKMFGFDAAIDHRDPAMAQKLADACPEGIDIYFENIGGKVFEAVLPLLNDFARIPVCGLISQYNDSKPSSHAETSLASAMRQILVKRLTYRGFIVTDFAEFRDEFLAMASPLVVSGKLAYLEDIVGGLENAPEAFISLLGGGNRGKLIVQLG